MLKKVKKVEVAQDLVKKDITEQLAGQTIYVTLNDGSQINIELFERDNESCIQICAGTNRVVIIPSASNVIKVKTDR
jgi:hypothetical protein